MECFHFSMCTL